MANGEWQKPTCSDPLRSLRIELASAVRAGVSKPPRSYRQWLEECVILPDGRWKGQRFRVDRQPVVGLWIDAIDSGEFTEFVFTAPSQFGKTLIAFVGPLLYHTCELGENYVQGVPFSDMAANKWELDVRPVMAAAPELRSLLPTAGSGSAGGKIRDMVTLKSGVVIKLMAAGADDAGKAGFTARVLGVTEAARFSSAGDSSVEADPLRQLRARQRSFPADQRRTYVEGTTTIAEELPWTLKKISTDSRIAVPCPSCEQWITPEREHLVGWEGCRSENEAADKSQWTCPECSVTLGEDARRLALLAAKLLHRGQSIDSRGRTVGDPPDTSRLFFRASAFHNSFLSAGDIGRDEWKAAQIPEESIERHSADRELCQFVHCVPYVSPLFAEDLILDKRSISSRRLVLPALVVPPDTRWLTAGIDIGEKKCWWLLLATRVDAAGNVYRHVVGYGDVDVPSERTKLDVAIRETLESIHAMFAAGFVVAQTNNASSTEQLGTIALARRPDQEWYDCNFATDTVLQFVKSISAGHSGQPKYTPWIGAYGRGSTQMHKSRGNYSAPRKTNNTVRDISPDGLWYLERIARAQAFAAIWDSDTTKWQCQQALTLRAFVGDDEPQTPGSVTLHAGTAKIHERLAQHLTNERLETKDTGLRGKKRYWVRHGANHLLDCFAMAWRAAERAKHIATKTHYAPPTPVAERVEQLSPIAQGPVSRNGDARKLKSSWYDAQA